MRKQGWMAVVLASVLTAAPALADTTCGASASERNAFLGSSIIGALDKGRDAKGALSGWAEQYIRDADVFGAALERFCADNASVALGAAVESVVTQTSASIAR